MRDRKWHETEALLDAALDLPPEAREEFLANPEAGDPEIRARVRRLLSLEAPANAFFGQPAAEFGAPILLDHDAGVGASGDEDTTEEASDPRAPTRIGRYRIVREIGRGGMGTVHLAERDDEHLRQRVALKVLRRGLDTDDLVRRFHSERQILASLDHPNIARVFDAGGGDDGRPYYVMEYVDGVPLTEYANAKQLGLPARLRLFMDVGRAVAHAHARLVVHRDLKPSNILVSGQGVVKLLDFGVAKVLEGALEIDETPPTRTGVRPMTPEYASPEQVRGEAVTTATDIYQLGLVLDRLVSGPSPVKGSGGVLGGRAAGSDRAGGHPRQPGRNRLPTDLRTIIATALHEDPARRYGTADQLVEDIHRFLAARPISARADTWGYRARRYVARHPAAAATAGLGALLLAGYVVTLQLHADRLEAERERARIEAQRASQVTEFLVGLFDPGDFQAAGRDTITARHLVQRGAANIGDALREQPLVRSALAGALGRIYVSLGLHDEADELLAEALELQRNHGSADGDLADALHNYGRALMVYRDFERAEPLLREALAIRRADPETRPAQLASVLSALALTWRDLEQADSAEVLITEALALRREAQGETHPAYTRDLHTLAMIRRALDDLEGAEALYREVLARQEASASGMGAGTIYNDLAYLLVLRGEFAEAESFYRAALENHRAVYGDLHRTTATMRSNLAAALAYQGNLLEAESVLRENIEILQQTLAPDHWRIGSAVEGLGRLWLQGGDFSRAETLLRDGADIYARGLGSDHPWTNQARARLAGALIALGRLDEAEALLLHARAELGPSETDQAREARSTILEALDRLAEARNSPA